MRRRVAIIGAGAAGYFAAIAASESPSNHCLLIEATNRPLAKLLISGGGRCNVTNVISDPRELVKHYPRGSRELLGPFTRFNSAHTVEWFESRGVGLHAESDGRMFPVTNDSRTIEECLRESASEKGVETLLGRKISSVVKDPDGSFTLVFVTGEEVKASSLVLATGSSPSGLQIARSLGHKIVDPVPSLFTFEISDSRLEGLSGVSFDSVHARLICPETRIYEQRGPMLITHWGLSGPAVIKLSAWGARELCQSGYSATVEINFVPDVRLEECADLLLQRKNDSPKKRVRSDVRFGLPRAYWERILAVLEVREDMVWADAPKATIQRIARELTSADFRIQGKGKFKEEFVTCGGVSLREVDFRTMESKICPGLFFAGEILDIDGVTGGFNFQAAWTTGYLAGRNV